MSNGKKRFVLLGATGSIGENTLRVLRKHSDRLELVGVACNSSHRKLSAICREFNVPHAAIFQEAAFEEARRSDRFNSTELYGGMEGLLRLAQLEEADLVLVAVVGTLGLEPALAAIRTGKDLALASKEILVMAGQFFTSAVAENGVKLLPVDSEHNAIFQCSHGSPPRHMKRLVLTGSGGMFRDRDLATFHTITPEEATCHPNWNMGPKITVDSSTMANKGLEVIEAHWLFGIPPHRIEVVIHRASIIHSMVEFIDGSILAQLSPPSMTFSIQNVLLYPDRAAGTEPSLDFDRFMELNLEPPQMERYPCLGLAYRTIEEGGVMPAVFNAANEVSVDAFLKKRIGFTDIPKIIEKTLGRVKNYEPQSLEEVLKADATARKTSREIIEILISRWRY